MIENELYFILHAPRQSGKTTFLNFLTNKINNSGKMYALKCSLAALRPIKDRVEAITTIATLINDAMFTSNVEIIRQKAYKFDSLPGMAAPEIKVKRLLNQLCKDLDKDLVVFFDESDLLTGPGLLTFLAQIRDGFNDRDELANKFPRSLALVGMRDIRDYIASEHPDSSNQHLASPFNIVAERMTLNNFTQEEIGHLYRQHTEATGQVFDDAAIGRAWHWSEGQPWLVNALARQIIEAKLKNDYSANVTALLVDEAAESLIKRRDTHIDSLLVRLSEPRVKNIMESVLSGAIANVAPDNDDIRYCRDLGLLALTEDKFLRPSNPIYKEVIIRTLTDQIEKWVPSTPNKIWTDGNTLLLNNLLAEFQTFWRKIMDVRAKRLSLLKLIQYDEANHVIILFSFLQRALNGGATIIHEYAEGRGAVGLCAMYKGREYLVEVKLGGTEPIGDSLGQLSGYLDTAGEKEGWLVIFNKGNKKLVKNKFYYKSKRFKDKKIHIFGC
ncbi:MAG: AAA-like domain-containing protein [Deltaproteobacteria bacterium]|nr:AAA-like domain-containing protein [Deltaproteobacteria bacterium]